MFDAANWPDWVLCLRLAAAFLLTAALGTHAYCWHKNEAMAGGSPRKWMYWLYSMVFLVTGTVSFAKLCVAAAFRDYGQSSFHMAYAALLLALSYLALQAGVRRGVRK